jgi:hypothetical protein
MRSGVGAACACALDRRRDLEEAVLFFLCVVVEPDVDPDEDAEPDEEDCGAPGCRAPDTTGAALTKSTAPKMNSEARFFIASIGALARLTAPEPVQRPQDTQCQTARCPNAAEL